MSYAANTSVSVEQSRAEIERTLARYGADRFAYSTEPGRAVILFQIQDTSEIILSIKMTLPMPAKGEERFTHRKRYSAQVENPPEMVNKLWEQACRSSWRSLCLVIKAKLEACACGISTVEREFLADVVLPDRRTVSEWLRPQFQQISDKGQMPKLLLT